MPSSLPPDVPTLPAPELVADDRLELLRAPWAALWEACPAATPFQAPDWLLPWACRYAPGRCRAVVLRAGGDLVALLPAFEWQGVLLLAGTGPSDFGDGLFRPGHEAAAGRMIAALARSAPKGCRRIDFRQLRPGSPLLDTAVPQGWQDEEEGDAACPVLRLRGPDGMDGVSARWRSNWRYAMRRIARDGGTADLVPAAEVTEAVRELARLHGLRWRQRGQPGVLSDPLLSGFLADAALELAAARRLRLHRLRFGKQTAAVLLALAGHGETHYYLSGFDPDCARLSPGTALVGAAIARAAHDGATAFHFLRGGEAYKYRWGAEAMATRRRILVRTG